MNGWRGGICAVLVCLAGWAGAAPLKVGVTSGPHAQVMEKVAEVAKARFGLDVEVVEFTDYIQPNAALAAGDLDANSYQHRPFFNAQVKARGYDLVGIGKTFTGPIAFYSQRYQRFDQVPDGAQVGIPNDPANESRVLLLLQANGLLTLRQGIDPQAGVNATPIDITANPHHFEFVELDAAQLPRSLPDLAVSAVNADYALKAGLNPSRDAILSEKGDGPYACLIAVRRADAGQPWVQQLLQAYQSPEVKAFIETTFKGAILPAF
ncbi:MetQ/NlpA family ABC transporter substrate-binding protein [Pseudomonas sp. NPDC007930]|uniref:MetQ/NlpA family ABC transporter substrate-binding protein n=1 Tax=Pseudomonas sp. NPDC007930 TaxID=3364417 RepID=UPI0036E1069A